MSVPGFNAEASVYKTNKNSHSAGPLGQANNVVYPASCFGDCFQDCLKEGHMSKSGCTKLCESDCGGKPKDNPPYVCTPRDNSVNRNLCLGGIWAWEQACKALCAPTSGVPVGGPALKGACDYACTKAADQMRIDCPPDPICV